MTNPQGTAFWDRVREIHGPFLYPFTLYPCGAGRIEWGNPIVTVFARDTSEAADLGRSFGFTRFGVGSA